VPKLESHYQAVLEPSQLIKQPADLLLKFELLLAGDTGSAAAAIQPGNPYKLGPNTKQWLSRLYAHVFDSAELIISQNL
jgi:hypothetical protein